MFFKNSFSIRLRVVAQWAWPRVAAKIGFTKSVRKKKKKKKEKI
jgi:hypothetical protein